MSQRTSTPRALVAGIGNVLRGDDGFGPAVLHALEASGKLLPGVRTVELGIGGIGLVHELMDGYDLLVIVDAVDRDGAPGSLYVLELQVPDVASIPAVERRELVSDMHQAVPGRALLIAQALGALPPVVRMVGCQPAETETFSLELSSVVQETVPKAVEAILSLLNHDALTTDNHETEITPMTDPMNAVFWRDELLQMMYWFRGEGLGDAVTPQDLLRFLDADEALVRRHLDRLVRDGYAVRVEETPVRYRLTEMGVEEGGRRFADEFAEMTKPGHGACSNPNCACHSLGPDACEARTAHDHG